MMGWMAPLRHLSAKLLSDRISSEWEPSMGEVTTIGLDFAKHVFQVHGVDAEGATVLPPSPPAEKATARQDQAGTNAITVPKAKACRPWKASTLIAHR
jgi:hypothetical protein